MIHDQDLHGAFSRLQFRAELLLEGHKMDGPG